MSGSTLAPVLIAVFLLPSASCAAEACPWVNAATVGGIFGSPTNATVTRGSSGGDDADCDFARKSAPLPYELRIGVRTSGAAGKEFAASAAQCGVNSTPLKSIGNETVMCSVNSKDGSKTMQVVGRVRNRIFTIRIGPMGSSSTLSSLGEQARQLAEHVAGNLF